MITKLPNEFLSVISENNGLKQYLSNLSKGRDFTPRSWLYENKDPDAILADWLEILSRLEGGDTFQQNVYQFDTAQMSKWGPQGGIPPIQDILQSVVEPTFQNKETPKLFKSREWDGVIAQVVCDYRDTGTYALRPASYNSVVFDMRARDTLESNSGWPDFARRNKPHVLNAAIQAAEDGEWIDYPAIALFRNYNQKTRLVWMFPEAANINEGAFVQPAQSSIIKSKLWLYSPWTGFDAVRSQVTAAYAEGKFLSASDFSKTDEHFALSTTWQVFDILKQVFQKAYSGRLRASLERMHTIPLVISPTEMLTGKHGVSSGSNWTNFVETVFDHAFSTYFKYYYNSSWNTVAMAAIGDDMCWVSDEYDDKLDHKLAEAGKLVGQDVNPEKVTNQRDQVKFLQRLFQRGYSRPDGEIRGVYSTIRALKSSVYPERFHKPESWSTDMFCARQYMILENCVDHPLFEDFVKFIVKGQKDLIPFALKSASELNKITRQTKLLPGFNPTYNQEKRDTSLASFASIGIAKTL